MEIEIWKSKNPLLLGFMAVCRLLPEEYLKPCQTCMTSDRVF